jgi:hypothetical protein
MSMDGLRGRFRWIALVSALLTVATGCVQRRMTVRSNPPGAMVYVDDYPIGTTPVSTDFTYYGTRKVRLVKDGFETLTVYQPMKTPWYEWFGIDFFSENIWPGEIRDERAYEFQMIPTVQVPNEQLIGRAEQMRANSQPALGAVVPPTSVLPPGAIVAPAPNIPPPVSTTPPAYLPPGNIPTNSPIFGAPPP